MAFDNDKGVNPGEFLPYDVEVEQALLGSIIVDNRKLAVALAELSPSDFYVTLHQRIFERMIVFDEDQRPITDVTLRASLKNDAAAAEVDDLASYLYEITIALARSGTVEGYCSILVDLRERREARAAVDEAQEDIYRGKSTARALSRVVDVADAIAVRQQHARGSADIGDAFYKLAQNVEKAAKGGVLAGLTTGLGPLDRQLGGYMPSDLIIVAGRPGMGKSVFACQAARVAGQVSDGGGRLYDPTIFSLEMSGQANAARMIAELDYDESVRLGRPPLQYTKIEKGRLTDDEFERFVLLGQQLQDLGVKVYDEGRMTVSKIGSLARARAQLSPRKPFIIVDNIQIVGSPEGQRSTNRVEILTDITGALKALAKRLDCPVLALSHLNRQVEAREDKRPNLGDLRESGSIEQDADAVLFLYRPEYYLRTALKHARATKSKNIAELVLQSEQLAGVLEIDVAKNRAGATGDVQVFIDVASNAIRNKKPEPGVGAPAQLPLATRYADPLDQIDLDKRTGP